MLSTLLSVPAWRAAVPAQRSLVRRRGACAMAATARTAFSAADFPAEWPYAADDFSRLDEQPDIQFYSAPRFVTHIDDGAIATLKQYYDEQLPEGADVLDICSSWISRLPPDKPLGRVVGSRNSSQSHSPRRPRAGPRRLRSVRHPGRPLSLHPLATHGGRCGSPKATRSRWSAWRSGAT